MRVRIPPAARNREGRRRCTSCPAIDPEATGTRINELRKAKGYSVPFLKEYFGFATTNAVYKWLRGETLPSLDNMFALSVLFGIPMNDIIVASEVLETNGVT